MFERYTEKARRVIFFARYEASSFGSQYIESEHLLLGLLREDKSLANRFLRSHTAVESIRRQIEEHTTIREKTSTSVDLPLSHDCKRALAWGAEEAERLGHKAIATTHLLAGLLREESSFATRILHERGLYLAAVRQELEHELGEVATDVSNDPGGAEKKGGARMPRIYDMPQEMKSELSRQAQARGIEPQALLQTLIEKALYPPPVRAVDDSPGVSKENYTQLRGQIEAEGAPGLDAAALAEEITRRKGARRL